MAKLPRSKKRSRANASKNKSPLNTPKVQPWSNEPMVPINLTIWCGTPAPKSVPQKFTFREEAPAIYCGRRSSTTPSPYRDIVHKYITTLIDKHDPDIMGSKNWKCAICGCRAVTMLYSSMPCLTRPQCECHFEPSVQVFAVPSCQTPFGRNCGQKGHELMDRHGDDLFPEHELNPMRCHNCQAKPGQDGRVIKKCLGCRLVGYCCKECQSMDWYSHKVDCKRVQEEERQEGFEEAKQWRQYLFG